MVLGTVPKDACQIKDFAIFNHSFYYQGFYYKALLPQSEGSRKQTSFKEGGMDCYNEFVFVGKLSLGMYQAEGAMTHQCLPLHPTHQSFLPLAEKLG